MEYFITHWRGYLSASISIILIVRMILYTGVVAMSDEKDQDELYQCLKSISSVLIPTILITSGYSFWYFYFK